MRAGKMQKIRSGAAAGAVVILLVFQGAEKDHTARQRGVPGAVLVDMTFAGGHIENVVIRPALWAQRSPADFVNMINAAGVDIQRIIESDMFAAVDKASPSLLPAL